VEAVTLVSEPLQTGSSDLSETAEFDFSGLDDATVEGTGADKPALSPDLTGNEKVCPVCNLPIVGAKGRTKYHPDCRPSAAKRVVDGLNGATGTTVRGRASNKEKEADEIVILIRKRLVQGVFFVMMADQYDGFVLMSAVPGICENVRGVLVAHDQWRKELLKIKEGGSIFGLIFAVLMPVAAICAHHGLIPFARISDVLQNLPKVMFRVQQRLKEGEQATEDMMTRIGEEFLKRDGGSASDFAGQFPNRAHNETGTA
jgi:hypothetical protein